MIFSFFYKLFFFCSVCQPRPPPHNVKKKQNRVEETKKMDYTTTKTLFSVTCSLIITKRMRGGGRKPPVCHFPHTLMEAKNLKKHVSGHKHHYQTRN
ncbi:hypothetical protein, unlikely [Trypanosoma brucei gambiense DAL972]|uniref:T. brucei spp.-specific protein n=1 Tax=Trypanosoma brucei gambiense (strain MHOM/CI/86/DAL972) TaxID=679716 RepID=C9ZR35_TRYB9|nr:hypothetical protein, unlikely [Trypanosoma brucei gambiense DAL972]CBH11865.1 hypothetical protein, unlikely [Trypanosoma brucei gambiense DAL972]|eukprot:XP_011774150.1 hypothetical protein, unlikely [Trypanosoma brucei gambiense DAL972]